MSTRRWTLRQLGIPGGATRGEAVSAAIADPRAGLVAAFTANDLGPHLVSIEAVAVGYEFNVPGQVTTAAGEVLEGEIKNIVKPIFVDPTTGLPVLAMPSTTFLVQLSSMPMTTTAATFGLQPVPISVRKCSSRSAPNCRRP